MSDDGSKLEWYDDIFEKWVIVDVKIHYPLFKSHLKYRLTTSDSRVYISEPNGEFYEVMTADLKCPLHGVFIDYDKCYSCKKNISKNIKEVHCKECQGE